MNAMTPCDPEEPCAEIDALLDAPDDDVATLLVAVQMSQAVRVGGARSLLVQALTDIDAGQKIALRAMQQGTEIRKLGSRIGHSTQAIACGDWVHLHNLASAAQPIQTGVSKP